MRGVFLICALALPALVGCTKHDREAREQAELNKQTDEQLRALKSQLDEARAGLQEQLDEFRNELSKASNDLLQAHGVIESLRADVTQRESQITSMSQTIDRAKAHYYQQQEKQRQSAARLNAATASAQGAANPGLADFIHPPLGTNPDLFPVRVFKIEGKKVVTGTHTEWQEKTPLVVDANGYPAHYGDRYKPKSVNDYGYQVSFSIRNLTKTAKTVSIDAGSGAREFSLNPDQSLDDLLIAAQNGSAPIVSASGLTRSFQVNY